MRRAQVLIAAFVIAALGVPTGCESFLLARRSAWDNLFRDNNAEDAQAILARLPASQATTAPENALAQPLVVAVQLGTPPHLTLFDLASGETLWDREVAQIDSRPLILGDMVLFVAGRYVMAWDLRNGSERWRYQVPEDWTFRGAAVEAGRCYVTVGKGRLGSVQRRDGIIVALDARDGSRLWEHTVPFLLGAPAAEGGLVFVPWDGQNMTVLDGTNGHEVARFRSLDDVIHFVMARPEGVFYGARALYRLTSRSASGRVDGATHYALPVEGIPGEPEFDLSGYELPGLSMRKIRFFWAPQPAASDEAIALADDTIYLLYFRFILAYDSNTGQIRWTYRYDEDVEAVQVVPGGLFLVGRHGRVVFVGAESGGVEWQREMGFRVRSVTFSLGAMTPPDRQTVEPRSVRQGLQEIIFDPDNRLLPVRTYALQLLTQIDDPEVTQDLLEIHAREGVPEQLREAAAQALSERASGGAFLVDALGTHYDFLLQTSPPPLDIVARTLVRMDSREAVPQLLEHLMDHETSLTALREVAAAVVALGDASVVGPLRDFLVRYHADSAFAENAEALNVMVDGLLRHGNVAEREVLERIQADPATLLAVRTHIAEAFAALEAAAQPEETPAETPEDTGPTPEEVCAEQREANYQLSQEDINRVMVSHADELRPCFMAEMERNPDAGMIRIVFLLTSEGEGMNWDVMPNSPELLTCLLPHLRAIHFPCIRAYRQRARFGVNLIRPRAAEPPPPETPPETPGAGTPGGWGPPPPGTTGPGTPGGTPGETPPTEYPEQYPDELPE